MSTNGLYVGRNGIAMPVLSERTGMTFERAERGGLLPALRELEPQVVLLADEAEGSTLSPDIAVIRSASEVPLLAMVRDRRRGIEALRAGADAVVETPVILEEVVLKIEALMRICGDDDFYPDAGDSEIELDRLKQRVLVRGEEIALTPTEFRMLAALARTGGAVVGHLELRDEVWRDSFHDRAEVKLYVSYLRRKFAAVAIDPIETVRGVGYRYCPRATAAKAA